MIQHVAGIQELVGSDVNLVHRLMKNHITEHTGWKAYSLFTKYAMECLNLEIDDAYNETETYEHLGDIETVSIDLLPRYEALAASRQYYYSDSDVDATVAHDYEISDVELWQILTSTEILTQMMMGVRWQAMNLPGGRTGVGAQNHCFHGKGVMRMTIVDWHPFTYLTGHCIDGRQKFYQMYEIEPLPNGGSRLHFRWKADMGYPGLINKIIGAGVARMSGVPFCKSIEEYIQKARKPTFQPEAE